MNVGKNGEVDGGNTVITDLMESTMTCQVVPKDVTNDDFLNLFPQIY